MSFDDIARRMKSRHVGIVPTLHEPASPAHAPPDADAFTRSMIDAERRDAKNRNLLLGGVLLVIGLVITLATYDNASNSGGTYVIAYGPMIVGGIRLFRGLST